MVDLITHTIAETLAGQLTDPADAEPLARLVLGAIAAHGRLLPAIGDHDPAVTELTEPALVHDQLCAGGC